MDYSASIKAKIRNTEDGKLFVSRDFAHLAPRNCIDRNLSDLARKGVIVRVARGIFMRNIGDAYKPTVEEVANAKARAFSRRIKFLHTTIYNNNQNADAEYTFLCDGTTTSFRYENSKITFRATTPKRLKAEIDKRELFSPAELGLVAAIGLA